MSRVFWYNDLRHDLMYSLLKVDHFSERSREHTITALKVPRRVGRKGDASKETRYLHEYSILDCVCQALHPHPTVQMVGHGCLYLVLVRVIIRLVYTQNKSAFVTCYLEV